MIILATLPAPTQGNQAWNCWRELDRRDEQSGTAAVTRREEEHSGSVLRRIITRHNLGESINTWKENEPHAKENVMLRDRKSKSSSWIVKRTFFAFTLLRLISHAAHKIAADAKKRRDSGEGRCGRGPNGPRFDKGTGPDPAKAGRRLPQQPPPPAGDTGRVRDRVPFPAPTPRPRPAVTPTGHPFIHEQSAGWRKCCPLRPLARSARFGPPRRLKREPRGAALSARAAHTTTTASAALEKASRGAQFHMHIVITAAYESGNRWW